MQKNKRIVKKAVLVIVEDFGLMNLVSHIKRVGTCNPEVVFKIRNAGGGSIADVLKMTKDTLEDGDFVKAFSIYDIDRLNNVNQEENTDRLDRLREQLPESHVEIHVEPVCLEGFLLQIRGSRVPRVASSCKSQLEKEIRKGVRGIIDSQFLEQKFGKTVLLQQRKKIKLVDQLFKIFEDDYL